jgi:hypothetical protein
MSCPLASMVVLASLLCFGPHALAAGVDLPSNGWASWQVPTFTNSRAWCCLELDITTACKLDDRNSGFASHDGKTTDAMRIYAHFSGGKLDHVRTLSADCAVQSAGAIRNLSLSEEVSVDWLAGVLDDKSQTAKDLRTEVMMALSAHRAPQATRALIGIAQNKLLPREERKRAIFWLAQSGSDSALAYLDQVIGAAR